MTLDLFDFQYKKICETVFLKCFHVQDPSAFLQITQPSKSLSKVKIDSPFRAVCHVDKERVFAIIPQSNGLIFNLERLKIGDIGITEQNSPCILRGESGSQSFLFLELDAKYHHYQLLSSAGMALKLPETLLFSESEDKAADIFIHKATESIKCLAPAMRPMNLHGRSRISRKNLVSDLLKVLCQEINTKQAVQIIMDKYHVSDRTVRNAFIEVVGITPKQFLKEQVLFNYRKNLLNKKDGSIESICDYLHISNANRIAKSYFKLFKEKPLTTLKKHYMPK